MGKKNEKFLTFLTRPLCWRGCSFVGWLHRFLLLSIINNSYLEIWEEGSSYLVQHEVCKLPSLHCGTGRVQRSICMLHFLAYLLISFLPINRILYLHHKVLSLTWFKHFLSWSFKSYELSQHELTFACGNQHSSLICLLKIMIYFGKWKCIGKEPSNYITSCISIMPFYRFLFVSVANHLLMFPHFQNIQLSAI